MALGDVEIFSRNPRLEYYTCMAFLQTYLTPVTKDDVHNCRDGLNDSSSKDSCAPTKSSRVCSTMQPFEYNNNNNIAFCPKLVGVG